MGSRVDGRLCNLRVYSENLGNEKTLELESGRKEGPGAPQEARRAVEGMSGGGGHFLGVGKQPFLEWPVEC